MRIWKILAQVLLVVALFSVPVAAIGAQSGAAVSGFIWDGATYAPDLAPPEAPRALPQTGDHISGFVWDGITYVPDITPSGLPLTLPQSGTSLGS